MDLLDKQYTATSIILAKELYKVLLDNAWQLEYLDKIEKLLESINSTQILDAIARCLENGDMRYVP